MSEMRVMDKVAGDLKVIWDPDNEAEVAAARQQFTILTKEKGYMAYRVQKEGAKGEQIRNFDPKAESIILAPALVGG